MPTEAASEAPSEETEACEEREECAATEEPSGVQEEEEATSWAPVIGMIEIATATTKTAPPEIVMIIKFIAVNIEAGATEETADTVEIEEDVEDTMETMKIEEIEETEATIEATAVEEEEVKAAEIEEEIISTSRVTTD